MLLREVMLGEARKSDGVQLANGVMTDLGVIEKFNSNGFLPLSMFQIKRSSKLKDRTDVALIRWFDDQAHITIESSRSKDVQSRLHNELYGNIGPNEFFESSAESGAYFVLNGATDSVSVDKIVSILSSEGLEVFVEDYRGDVDPRLLLVEVFEGYNL